MDLLDGSPPCSAFSTAGKREAGWGKAKSYSDDKHQVVEDLFFEYARLVRDIQPRVFVAENVSGLVKGTAKGYFLEILRALKSCGYRVEAKLLDAQWLGVPQARQRLIFVGVRDDLARAPVFPAPLPYRYSVRDALPWVIAAKRDDSGAFGNGGPIQDRPAPTILAASVGTHWVDAERIEAVVEPESDMRRYAVGAEWRKLKPGGQSEKYFQLVRAHPDAPSPTMTARGGDATAASVAHPTECRKFSIAELKRICGFPDDFQLLGTYQQQWERCGRAVPPVMMSHVAAAVRDRVLQTGLQ